MPRPRSVTPSHKLKLSIREDLRARLDLELFSPLEGRVPHGAYKEFFDALLARHFTSLRLPLAPYGIGGVEQGLEVVGLPEAIASLRHHLERTEELT